MSEPKDLDAEDLSFDVVTFDLVTSLPPATSFGPRTAGSFLFKYTPCDSVTCTGFRAAVPIVEACGIVLASVAVFKRFEVRKGLSSLSNSDRGLLPNIDCTLSVLAIIKGLGISGLCVGRRGATVGEVVAASLFSIRFAL
jgi:hypothetical protein